MGEPTQESGFHAQAVESHTSEDIEAETKWPLLSTIFSDAFSSMRMHELRLTFSLKFVPKGKFTMIQHWFRNGLASTKQQAIIWNNDV